MNSEILFKNYFKNCEPLIDSRFYNCPLNEEFIKGRRLYYTGIIHNSFIPPNENIVKLKSDYNGNKFRKLYGYERRYDFPMIFFTQEKAFAEKYALKQYDNEIGWLFPLKIHHLNIFNANNPSNWRQFQEYIHGGEGYKLNLSKRTIEKLDQMRINMRMIEQGLKSEDWLFFLGDWHVRNEFFRILYYLKYDGFFNYEDYGGFPSIGLFSNRAYVKEFKNPILCIYSKELEAIRTVEYDLTNDENNKEYYEVLEQLKDDPEFEKYF